MFYQYVVVKAVDLYLVTARDLLELLVKAHKNTRDEGFEEVRVGLLHQNHLRALSEVQAADELLQRLDVCVQRAEDV